MTLEQKISTWISLKKTSGKEAENFVNANSYDTQFIRVVSMYRAFRKQKISSEREAFEKSLGVSR